MTDVEIAQHQSRALDWGCAVMILAWGIALLIPGNTLTSAPAYESILDRAPEWAWGALCIAVGLIRGVALIVNGRIYEGSPIIRAVAAAIGAMVWVQFLLAFLIISNQAGVISLGVPAALVMAGLDLFCAARAGSDAIHGRRARVGG